MIENTLDNSGKLNQNGDKIPQKTAKKVQTARELIANHITNKDHVITDEEFESINTDIALEPDATAEALEIENTKERPKDESKDHPVTTPWDVLNE